MKTNATATTAQPVLKSTVKWIPVGLDFGNSETITSFTWKGEQHRTSGPTAFCPIDPKVIRNLAQGEIDPPTSSTTGAKKGKAKGKAKPSQATTPTTTTTTPTTMFSAIQLQGEGITQAVGDFALRQGKRVWSGRGDHKRYASKYSVLGLLAHICTKITEKEFGLFVVTGLPADLYTKHLELRKEIKEALDGTYVFSLDGGETWRTAHIFVSLVVMEGAGALLAYSKRTNLVMTKSTMGAVIDIGGGTVDLYVARGAQPIAEYCKSDRSAVEAAGKLVREIFSGRYSGGSLTDLEVREIMYAHANKDKNDQYPYPQISVFGELIDEDILDAIATEAISQIAGDIVTFVMSSWREADGGARFDPLLLVGGGYHSFFLYVKERIPHIKVFNPDEVGEFFPTDANAEGYAQIATRRLTQQQEADAAIQKEALQQAQAQQAEMDQQMVAIEEQASSSSDLLEEEELQHAAAASATASSPNLGD